jgi:hypothetical protein
VKLLSAVLNAVRGYRSSFDELENSIFDSVRLQLPAAVLGPFTRRIEDINVVQPILGGMEVNFYERRHGKILFPEHARILMTDDVVTLATIRLVSTDKMSNLRAKLFCGRGTLTSLEFNEPSEHAQVENIEAIEVHIMPTLPWTN